MERQVWLAERRAALVAGYDAEAATYDDEEYPWGMQREWVARVLRLLYLTVHELQPHHIEWAFESLSALGQPAVRGELAEPDAPGYHYCPGRDKAVDWFRQQGLAIIDEGFRRENGWGYRHFLLRTSPASPAA